MPYQAEISRTNPTAFIFLIDQSGSMDEMMPEGVTKASGAADALNKLLTNLCRHSTKSEGVRDYFHIAVIGYGGAGVVDALPGGGDPKPLRPISAVWAKPLRVEQRQIKQSDGAGGIIEMPVKFPVWFDPMSDGATPMCAALRWAAEVADNYVAAHSDCFPPLEQFRVQLTHWSARNGDRAPVLLLDCLVNRNENCSSGQHYRRCCHRW